MQTLTIAIPLSLRTRKESESIGYYANLVMIDVDIASITTFVELLALINDKFTKAKSNKTQIFEKNNENIKSKPNIIFNWQFSRPKSLKFGENNVKIIYLPNINPRFDIGLDLRQERSNNNNSNILVRL